jgi:hypothetical protein
MTLPTFWRLSTAPYPLVVSPVDKLFLSVRNPCVSPFFRSADIDHDFISSIENTPSYSQCEASDYHGDVIGLVSYCSGIVSAITPKIYYSPGDVGNLGIADYTSLHFYAYNPYAYDYPGAISDFASSDARLFLSFDLVLDSNGGIRLSLNGNPLSQAQSYSFDSPWPRRTDWEVCGYPDVSPTAWACCSEHVDIFSAPPSWYVLWLPCGYSSPPPSYQPEETPSRAAMLRSLEQEMEDSR